MERDKSINTPAAMAYAEAPLDERSVYSKVSWRLIPFLLMCYTAGYLDRVNVGFAKLQMLDQLRYARGLDSGAHSRRPNVPLGP